MRRVRLGIYLADASELAALERHVGRRRSRRADGTRRSAPRR